jgi:hypothetical protein
MLPLLPSLSKNILLILIGWFFLMNFHIQAAVWWEQGCLVGDAECLGGTP